MKKIIITAYVLIVAIIGYITVGPYLAINAIKNSIVEKDIDGLKDNIDFPILKENIKEQLNSFMIAEIQKDEKMKNNPFAGMATAMIPAIVNNAVDGYVSASGLTLLANGKNPNIENNSSIGALEMFQNADRSFESTSKYTIKPKSVDGHVPKFVFTRDGLDWKLTNIELPLMDQNLYLNNTEKKENNTYQYNAESNDTVVDNMESPTYDTSSGEYLKNYAHQMMLGIDMSNDYDIIIKNNSKGSRIYCLSNMSMCKTEQEVLDYFNATR